MTVARAIVIAEPDYAQRVVALESGLTRASVLLQREGPLLGILATAGAGPAQHLQRVLRSAAGSQFPADLAMLIYTAGTTGPVPRVA